MVVLEASASQSVASRSTRKGRHTERPPGRARSVPAARVLAPVACGHRKAPVPLSHVVALGLATCLVVVGLGVLANLGSGAGTVPERTAVVRVVPGETLDQVAERAAPAADRAAVVERIRVLNGLPGSDLRPGQPLTVPIER